VVVVFGVGVAKVCHKCYINSFFRCHAILTAFAALKHLQPVVASAVFARFLSFFFLLVIMVMVLVMWLHFKRLLTLAAG